MRAVSKVNGGNGGLPESWVLDAIVLKVYRSFGWKNGDLNLSADLKGNGCLNTAADMDHESKATTPCD